MKNKEINLDEITAENIENTDLWKICEEPFNTSYAKILSKNPKDLESFKKYIIKEYNKTKEFDVFLEQLKIVAVAEGTISELAKKSKMKRSNIYRFLSKNSNPTFGNLELVANNLGITFNACLLK